MDSLMQPKTFISLVLFSLTLSCLSVPAFADEYRSPWSGHFFYGQMNVDNDSSGVDGEDYTSKLLGMDAQLALGPRGPFQYGVEFGVLASWESDTRVYSASAGGGGGTVTVSMDVNSYLIDCFAGGYIALEPMKWLRIHAGAGPLVIWGKWETEPNEPAPEPFYSESETKVGVGLYARTGLDIFFTDRLGVHAGIRVNTTTLTLENASEEVDIKGWQYYFGMAYHF